MSRQRDYRKLAEQVQTQEDAIAHLTKVADELVERVKRLEASDGKSL